jgi:hypothetical protein
LPRFWATLLAIQSAMLPVTKATAIDAKMIGTRQRPSEKKCHL